MVKYGALYARRQYELYHRVEEIVLSSSLDDFAWVTKESSRISQMSEYETLFLHEI